MNRFPHVAMSADDVVAVRGAAVVGVPDEYRGETVKAYVSRKSGAAVTEEEPIRFCKEQTAAYEYRLERVTRGTAEESQREDFAPRVA